VAEPLLEIRGLDVYYGSAHAVQGVDLVTQAVQHGKAAVHHGVAEEVEGKARPVLEGPRIGQAPVEHPLHGVQGSVVDGEKAVLLEGHVQLVRLQFVLPDGPKDVDHQEDVLVELLDLGPLIPVDEILHGHRVQAEQAGQGLQRLGWLSLGVHPQQDAGIPKDLCQGAEIHPGLHPAITMPDQNSLHAVRLLRVAPGERGAGS